MLTIGEPYRSALLLRFFEALPPRRIAERLALAVETVRTRLKRGLEQVRARLLAQPTAKATALMSWGIAAAALGLVLGGGFVFLGEWAPPAAWGSGRDAPRRPSLAAALPPERPAGIAGVRESSAAAPDDASDGEAPPPASRAVLVTPPASLVRSRPGDAT